MSKVKIKKLVWEGNCGWWSAQGAVEHYGVTLLKEGSHTLYSAGLVSGKEFGWGGTLETAKKICQDRHDKQIESALEFVETRD